MDALKALIAVTCTAVIAAVGYYFWGEYREASAIAERQEERQAVENELFGFAKAKPNEITKVRKWCAQLDERLDSDLKDNEMARQMVKNCRGLGYL